MISFSRIKNYWSELKREISPLPGQDCKEVNMCSTYNVVMSEHQECATKRIPVCPSTWEEIHGLRKPGQTFDEVIREMVKKEKMSRLAEDTDRICQRDRFVEYKL